MELSVCTCITLSCSEEVCPPPVGLALWSCFSLPARSRKVSMQSPIGQNPCLRNSLEEQWRCSWIICEHSWSCYNCLNYNSGLTHFMHLIGCRTFTQNYNGAYKQRYISARRRTCGHANKGTLSEALLPRPIIGLQKRFRLLVLLQECRANLRQWRQRCQEGRCCASLSFSVRVRFYEARLIC